MWLLVVVVEAVLIFAAGAILQLRVPLAAGLIALTLIVLRMIVAAVLALEGWLALLIAGVALLIIGTVMLSFRDALKDRLASMQARWHEMGQAESSDSAPSSRTPPRT